MSLSINPNGSIEPITILPASNINSGIVPIETGKNMSSIIPKTIGGKVDNIKNQNTGLLIGGIIVLVIVLSIYISMHVSFVKEFEDEWSRVESDGGSYYELVLEIDDGEIEYYFDSWLFDSKIATFEYTIIGPGMVEIDGRIINVKMEDDSMKLSPAITSPDKYEYWFK